MNEKEPPTESELRSAICDCFYAASQCAMYHYWFLLARPAVQADDVARGMHVDQLMANGVIEAALMFFRKTHEFFKRPGIRDRSDTLYAYRWKGYTGFGPVYPAPTILELHKRVGHITVREARYGKIEWPVFEMAIEAIDRWIHFFEFGASTYYADKKEVSDECSESALALRKVRDAMIRDKNTLEKKGQPGAVGNEGHHGAD